MRHEWHVAGWKYLSLVIVTPLSVKAGFMRRCSRASAFGGALRRYVCLHYASYDIKRTQFSRVDNAVSRGDFRCGPNDCQGQRMAD